MSDNEFHDRFERAFNARIPREVASSFSAEQLAAIKTAFGGERWDGHPVDLRATIPLLRWYFVFVGGSDRRSKGRLGLDDSPKPGFFGLLGRLVGGVVALVMLALLVFLLVTVMAG